MISYELTTWAILLLAPPGAALLVRFLRRRARRVLPQALVAVGFVFAVLAGGGAIGVRFMSGSANVAAFWILYAAYCVLVFGLGLIRRPLIRWPLQIAALVPIAYGYFFGTIGALALLFMVGNAIAPPTEVRRLDDGRVCHIINLDAGPGTNGNYADVYGTWGPLPLGLRVSRQHFRFGVEPVCR